MSTEKHLNILLIMLIVYRWRSLEAIPASCDQLDGQNKKSILKSWFVGLFNGNGLKSSNTSLKKGVMNDYNNLQQEKESIV